MDQKLGDRGEKHNKDILLCQKEKVKMGYYVTLCYTSGFQIQLALASQLDTC